MEKAPGYKMTDTAAAEGGNNSNEYVKTENESNANEDEDQTLKRVLTIKKAPGKCGSYTFNDGSRYIGDFDENGVRCGKGHLETPNGTTFEGQFNKGLPNGLGMMRFPDGSRYEGEFMQGWFHGHGIFATRDGTAFEGEFRGGRLWGKGLLSYKDGSPGTEGYFQDVRFSRECSASEDVKKAREVAVMAKSFCESDTDY